MNQPPPLNESSSSTTGLETNVASLLAYILGFVSGLIFLLIEKKDATVRWHAAQSFTFAISVIVLNIGLTFFKFLPLIGFFIRFFVSPILNIGFLIVWVILMIKAYQGKKLELPIVSQIVPAVLKIGA